VGDRVLALGQVRIVVADGHGIPGLNRSGSHWPTGEVDPLDDPLAVEVE
jgi:hypothetical protein